MLNRISTMLVLTVVISMTALYLTRNGSQPKKNELPEPTQQVPGYFVFADPNNVVDLPSYGNTDKFGVSKPVVDMFPSGESTFDTIGKAKSARETFVTQNGKSLHPDARWLVLIHNTGIVHGQKRIAVAAFHGRDATAGGLNAPIPLIVYELWSVNDDGSFPQLMERSLAGFEGPERLNTHAEVPATPPLVGGMPAASGLPSLDE